MSQYTPDIELPRTYKKEEHQHIKFDRECRLCELGERVQRHNEEQEKQPRAKYKQKEKVYSVGGAGPDNLKDVKLIILSDFPGHYESSESNCFPMVDILQNQETRKKGLLKPRNAGSFLRMALSNMYDLNTYTDCWITNAVKCNPLDDTIKESSHLKKCNSKWLANEFSLLDEYCPTAPLLVAGTLAFKALSNIYPESKNLLKEYGFNGSRRRSDLILGTGSISRGTVVTFNPARIARSEPRIESSISSKFKLSVTSNDWLYPPIPGSPVDLFIKDLRFLTPFLSVS